METDFPVSEINIENEIKKNGILPIRWSIVNVCDHTLTISVAGEKFVL